MPTIIPNQDFQHGGETYEKGTSYEVSEGEAYYFKMCGWLEGGSEASSEPSTLEIHDSQLGHGAEVK